MIGARPEDGVWVPTHPQQSHWLLEGLFELLLSTSSLMSRGLFPIHREAYSNCTVLEARPCYNVARLMFLDTER